MIKFGAVMLEYKNNEIEFKISCLLCRHSDPHLTSQNKMEFFSYWKDEIKSCNKDQANWGNKSNKIY
jgi:hypothetical protein